MQLNRCGKRLEVRAKSRYNEKQFVDKNESKRKIGRKDGSVGPNRWIYEASRVK